MRVFHLAIPCHDLDQGTAFYVNALGAKPARRYADRQTFRFFGHQLVCHLEQSLLPPEQPLAEPYPRHFGITFETQEDIEKVWARCRDAAVPHLTPIGWRFKEKPERHLTFWSADPTGNVLEFKWYEDTQYIF